MRAEHQGIDTKFEPKIEICPTCNEEVDVSGMLRCETYDCDNVLIEHEVDRDEEDEFCGGIYMCPGCGNFVCFECEKKIIKCNKCQKKMCCYCLEFKKKRKRENDDDDIICVWCKKDELMKKKN